MRWSGITPVRHPTKKASAPSRKKNEWPVRNYTMAGFHDPTLFRLSRSLVTQFSYDIESAEAVMRRLGVSDRFSYALSE